jgi:hypothetical protein
VTASGFSPTVGPFTLDAGISGVPGGLTGLGINDAASNQLALILSTPTRGSLVGYVGGALDSGAITLASHVSPAWALSSGSLTPAAAPEPPSLVLLLSALAALGVALRRRA